IADGYRDRVVRHRVRDCGRQSTRAVAEQNRDVARVQVGGDDVEPGVAVEVGERDDLRLCPTGVDVAAANVPSPLPTRTETLFASEFAVTASSFPSPFRSPNATAAEKLAVGYGPGGPTPPLPFPSKTVRAFESEFAVTRSRVR